MKLGIFQGIKRIPFGGGDVGAVLRAGSAAFAIRCLAAIAAYGVMVTLARWMEPAQFGIYSFVWAWATLLAVVGGLGLPVASVRFVSQYLSGLDWKRLHGLIRRTRQYTCAAGIAVTVIGVAAIVTFRDQIGVHYAIPLVIALCCVPLIALVNLTSETARAFGWMGTAFGPSLLAFPLILIAISAVLRQAAGSLNAVQVVAATIPSQLLVLVSLILVTNRQIARRVPTVEPLFDTAVWLKVSLPLLLIQGFVLLHLQTDLIMVGSLLTPERAAQYNAAAKTAFLIVFILQAGIAFGAPKFAQLYSENRRSDLQSLLSAIIHWTFWPSLSLTLIFVVFGDSILAVFGPSYVAAYWPLVILALGQLMTAAAGPVSVLLNMTGHQVPCARWLGISAGLNIVLNAILIPWIGLVGAAIGTAVSTLFWNVALLFMVIRLLGVQPSILPLKELCARARAGKA